eukprot:15119621-Alexandrium_andersonii.AAC.1
MREGRCRALAPALRALRSLRGHCPGASVLTEGLGTMVSEIPGRFVCRCLDGWGRVGVSDGSGWSYELRPLVERLS